MIEAGAILLVLDASPGPYLGWQRAGFEGNADRYGTSEKQPPASAQWQDCYGDGYDHMPLQSAYVAYAAVVVVVVVAAVVVAVPVVAEALVGSEGWDDAGRERELWEEIAGKCRCEYEESEGESEETSLEVKEGRVRRCQ